jgi:glycosyltransferase involved in cell wall biosynthesis
MKLVFLLPTRDPERGVFHSTMRTASSLRVRHSVEVWVVRDEPGDAWPTDPDLRVRRLVTVGQDDAPGDESDGHDGHLSSAPSHLAPPGWDRDFSELTDRELERALRTVDADVVVSTSPGTLAAVVSLARPGTALVHHERFRPSQRRHALTALRVYGPRVQAIVTGDEVTAAFLRKELGAAGPRVMTFPDPLPHGSLPHSRGNSNVITAAGSLTAENQFARLIRAFGEVAPEMPDWRLRVFGTGRLRKELTAAARKYLLFDRVEFPGTSAYMPIEWARGSVAVVTARGSVPLATAEAMAAGLPVVAHNYADGSPHLIEHERNGLLVGSDSQPSLSAALLRLAQDGTLRSRLGKAALESTGHLRPELVAKSWEDLFAEVTGLRDSDDEAAIDPATPVGAGSAKTRAPGVELPPEEARGRTLDLISRTAAVCSGEWFVLRPLRDRNPVVVMPVSARPGFLSRLAEDDNLNLFVDEDGTSEPRPPHGSLGAVIEALIRTQPSVLTMSVPRRVDGRATLACHGGQVDVEFWDEVGDTLLAPRANEWARSWGRDSKLQDIELCGLTLPTIPLAAEPTFDDRDIQVDAVYTWVDGDDPAWQAKRDARLADLTGLSLTRAASGKARFLSRDELRYSMRSLHLFAPWINHIYLVTDGQQPSWLDTDHPGVTVVSHDEILASEHLPTFNSHAIETGLYRIPSLSEHFIYFNDDVLLGRPMRPDHFFGVSGQFAAFVGDQILGADSPDALPFRRAGLNNRALLQEDFGRTITRTLRHTPHPFTRSVFKDLEQRYAAQLEQTAAAAFRSETDVSVASSLAQHFGLLTGAAYASPVDAAYVSITDALIESVLADLLATRSRQVICLADHHDWALPEGRVNVLVRKFLDAYYPVAAPWEK